MNAWSLAFIAHEVHRRGGQERAAAEILARVSKRASVTVIARVCELDGVEWIPVSAPTRPSVLKTWAFARAARRAERRAGCTITNSIGAAATDADVITAQFCHAAFTERYGGIRGGSPLGALYQELAQRRFTADERRAYGAARLRRVIAVSNGTARELQEYYEVPRERIRVVPNGVDHAVFRPAADAAAKRALRVRLALPTDALIALFVGGDWERKGVRDAIDAIGGVPDAHLVIVGRGDAAAMLAHAKRAGAVGRVHVVAPTPAPQDYYAASDLFLFPSRYEAFSLVTLEAAASGLPLVCHRINGTEELVTDGVNGWLVPFGANALRERVIALRDDTEVRTRMGAAALESSRRYAWDRVAEEYTAVLEEAVAMGAPSGARSRVVANATLTRDTQRDTFLSARGTSPRHTPARVSLRTLQIGMEWFPERTSGLNRVFYELVRHLPAVGVDVHGLVAGGPGVAAESGGLVESFAPYTSSIVPRMIALRRRGRAAVRSDPHRLVVAHFALYAYPLLGALGARPLVVHFQGPWGLEGSAERQGALVVAAKTAVERAVYRRATAFIVLSTPFGRILEERFGIPRERIHVIPGGVETDRFAIAASRAESRAKLGWPADRKIVLAVRRLTRRMGLDQLIAAVPRLRERVPDALVLIAGGGPIATELDREIHRLGVGDHVRLVGFVPDELLPYAYRAADVSIVPSVALEGFGLIVAESLAAGTPCLVTPVGGLPEAVGTLAPQLVLANAEPATIAEGLADAFTGKTPLPSAAECLTYARAHYDWAAIAARVREVYEAALR